MIWIVTVTENRYMVTRLVISNEALARGTFKDLESRKAKAGWLAVSLSQVKEIPVRSQKEKERAFSLLFT